MVKEDLLLYKPRRHEILTLEMRQRILLQMEHSVTMTIYSPHEAKVVAMGGIIPLWKGVGEVWILGSELIAKYPVETVRLIKRFRNTTVEQLDLHRLHCNIFEGFDSHKNFAEAFGFKQEGFAKNFGPNKEDVYYYGWVK
jgi:RimJ/RimL family protein N-acetyltransferase